MKLKKMHITGLVLVAFLVTGASCPDSAPPPETAQQIVYSVHASYNVALAAAVTYQKLTRCALMPAGTRVQVCSKQSVVDLLRRVNRKATTVLAQAERMSRKIDATEADKIAAKNLAAEAVGMLKGVLAASGINLPGG